MSLVVFGSRQPRFVLRGEFAHPVLVDVFSRPHGPVLLVLTLTLTRRSNTNTLVAQELSAQKTSLIDTHLSSGISGLEQKGTQYHNLTFGFGEM